MFAIGATFYDYLRLEDINIRLDKNALNCSLQQR